MGVWSELWDNVRTWFTDWVKSGVLKEQVTGQAMAHRKPISQSLLQQNAPHPEEYAKNLPEKPTDEELFRAFMFSGVDYRGQAQHGFETLGYGAGVNFSIDFAKVFLPPGVSMFLTASASADFSAKRASHRFLFISNQGHFTELSDQRGAQPISLPRQGVRQEDAWRLKNVARVLRDQEQAREKAFVAGESAWKPVVLSCMLGKWTNMKGGLGVSVGGKFDTSALTTISICDVETLGFSINLTASASGSMDGTWVFATDPTPLHTMKSEAKMSQWFAEHLKSTTSVQKKQFNQALSATQTDINSACYLSWWIHTKEATAGMSAAAVAKAGASLPYQDQTIGPGGTLTASVKGPSVKWTSKTSSYRLNNPCCNPDIVLSQETKILYKQVGGQILGLALDLELGCAQCKKGSVVLGDPQAIFIPQLTQKVDASSMPFGSYADKKEHGGAGQTAITETVAPPDLNLYKSANFKATLTSTSLKLSIAEERFKKLEKTWETVNSMSYETGVAFWSKQHQLMMEGSGFVVGQSLTLPGFIKYWNNCEECQKLFGAVIPPLATVKTMVTESIKNVLHAEASVLPSVENWLQMTGTGERRWKITSVDDALKAYWKHMNGTPWNAPKDRLPDLLAAQGSKSQATGTLEERARRRCGHLIRQAMEESKARGKLFAGILAGIEKWIASKGGEEAAGRNGRCPGVLVLRRKCAYEIERLDSFASVLDVAREYLDMRALETGLSGFLHVGIDNLRTFFCDKGLEGAVKDIVNLIKIDKGQVPGAFLIEASFKLSVGKLGELSRMPGRFKENGVDLGNDFTEAMKKKLEGSFDDSLQYISVRYRKADTRACNRSFKLGVNIGGGATKLGFSLDRVRQAGTEGNFMVSTVWFGQYRNANQQGGWPQRTVPMPVILS